MSRSLRVGIVIFLFGLSACQSNGPGNGLSDGSAGPSDSEHHNHSNAQADPSPQAGRPLAIVDGRAVTWQQLQEPLVEAAGGEIFAELVLDRMLERALQRRGLRVDSDAIDRERELLMRSLDADADQAQRVLDALRERRGLGRKRFEALLRRNAALRLMVQDEVEVTDAALRQAYEQQYGQRYEARLIVVPTINDAGRVIDSLGEGADFGELAAEHSTDPSAAAAGRLSPISPVDATYPAAVRRALGELEPGEVSDAIGLDEGFAILRLERIIEAQDVDFDSVADQLAQRIRRRAERTLMDRQVRVLIERADVAVFDSTLQRQWQRQRDGLDRP